MQGNDGYLYLFIDEQTPYIWKKVQIGVKAVGNILQSTKCMMGVLSAFYLWFCRRFHLISKDLGFQVRILGLNRKLNPFLLVSRDSCNFIS